MSDLPWESVAEADRTIAENWLFRLRQERFRSRRTGRAHDFYVMHLADCVNVITTTPDRRVVLVRQFRAGSRAVSLETPGGLLEPGEDPGRAGARELLEETGYVGDPPRVLGTVWSNPSILTSRATTIVIANARKVAEPALDPSEELQIVLVPADEITRLIDEGAIDHSLVVAGLLWWLRGR
jgi:8-oxo-dGTP pyrophosphatase MutT (NUDIX family)